MTVPSSTIDLLVLLDDGAAYPYLYFWGHTPKKQGVVDKSCLSQWWPCSFTVDGDAYSSAEQFMMAEKARVMGDAETRAEILATHGPAAVKKLGRKVRNYDEAKWRAARFDVVVRGNIAKFASDDALRAFLLATGDAVLVEASPDDAVWGIGLAEHDPEAKDPRTWKGTNLLGFALMHARAALKGS